ncbi:MAG: hypothetical protein Q4A15_07080 [Prevotellaceae bacterium]|nr:hypothetical protein [Prevotellaceae bacterium]
MELNQDINVPVVEVLDIGQIEHCCQIMAGLSDLQHQGRIRLKMDNCRLGMAAFVRVRWCGKTVVFDTQDGYLNLGRSSEFLKDCDFYFKRSFDRRLNKEHFKDLASKCHPLWLNYMVMMPGSLYCGQDNGSMCGVKGFVKYVLGMRSAEYFTCDKFEEEPVFKNSKDLRILFLTRLWSSNTEDPKRKEFLREINETRIGLIRALRKRYGAHFCGGLRKSDLAMQLAPDLIVTYRMSNRRNFLRLLHEHDICIASTGLHNSIGWKLAEYVAASKAIVSERLHYEVTGDFGPNKNYLEYWDVSQALFAVERLMSNPEQVYRMKLENWRYYMECLRPDAIVWNALKIAAGGLE